MDINGSTRLMTKAASPGIRVPNGPHNTTWAEPRSGMTHCCLPKSSDNPRIMGDRGRPSHYFSPLTLLALSDFGIFSLELLLMLLTGNGNKRRGERPRQPNFGVAMWTYDCWFCHPCPLCTH